MRILVLDDSVFARNMIVAELKAMGAGDDQIVQAQSGEEAIALIKAEAFELFILDIVMAGIDGIAVLKEARTLQPEAKVLMCSSSSADQMLKELISIGIQGFLAKPFKSDDFRKVVAQHIALPYSLSERENRLTVKCHVCDQEMIEVNFVNTISFYCPQSCMQIGPMFTALANQQDIEEEYENAKKRLAKAVGK